MAGPICLLLFRISKGAKIRNRYNQVPHLTQDTNEKVTNSQLDTTNQSQEVSLFPAGDHKSHINRRAQRHSKHKTEQNSVGAKSQILSSVAPPGRKTWSLFSARDMSWGLGNPCFTKFSVFNFL